MGLSFITLTNATLTALNEVPLSPTDFSTPRGIQREAQNAVKYAVQTINHREYEWPFNAAEQSVTLNQGQTVYPWPAQFKLADWDSFRLIATPPVLDTGRGLKFIERDYYLDKYLTKDDDAGAAGRDIPEVVAPAHTPGFIVSPSPDQTYLLRYSYWRSSPALVAATDDTRIPDEFEHVVVDGAAARLFAFKGNYDTARMYQKSFEDGVRYMRSLLINNYESVTDGRVRF